MNLGDFWWGDLFYYECTDLNVSDVFKLIYSFWCINHPSFVQQEPIQVGPEPFWWSLIASLLSSMTRYCRFIFHISWVCVLSRVQLFVTPWTVAPPGYSIHGVFQARIVDCHFLFQGIFPTQESKLHLLYLLYWQANSVPLCHQESYFLPLTRNQLFLFARNSFILVKHRV